MNWTFEKVIAALGDKAQATARGLVVLVHNEGELPQHLLIAEYAGEGTFTVTAVGLDYLASLGVVEKPAAKKPVVEKPAAKKPVVEPQSTGELSGLSID